MSDTPNHSEFFKSEVITFDPLPALLGLDTNGAAPQRIYGFFIEGEFYGDANQLSEAYWIKVTTSKGPFDGEVPRGDYDYLAYTADAKKIEEILGAIVNVSVNPDASIRLSGRVDGYRNRAQLEFDEELGEDCQNGLNCDIEGSRHGFRLKLSTLGTKKNEATVYARMTPDGIDAALKVAERVREFSSRNRDTTIELRNTWAAEQPTPTGI